MVSYATEGGYFIISEKRRKYCMSNEQRTRTQPRVLGLIEVSIPLKGYHFLPKFASTAQGEISESFAHLSGTISLTPWFTRSHTSDSSDARTGPPNTDCPPKRWGSDKMLDRISRSPESFEANVESTSSGLISLTAPPPVCAVYMSHKQRHVVNAQFEVEERIPLSEKVIAKLCF